MSQTQEKARPQVVALVSEAHHEPNLIHEWRQGIFSKVADVICDPLLPALQRTLGIWRWSAGLTQPQRDKVTIMRDGSMTFRIDADKHEPILISIWMFLGEIRVGAFIPHSMLSSDRADDLKLKISQAYDGRTCDHVLVQDGHGMMFDWIFRKHGPANDVIMANSLRDDDMMKLIADAVANITTHIYMAIMNALIQDGVMIATPKGIRDSQGSMQLLVDLRGENPNAIAEFESGVRGLAIKVVQIFPQSETRCHVVIETKPEAKSETEVAIQNLCASTGCFCDIAVVEEP